MITMYSELIPKLYQTWEQG